MICFLRLPGAIIRADQIHGYNDEEGHVSAIVSFGQVLNLDTAIPTEKFTELLHRGLRIHENWSREPKEREISL